MFQSHIKTFWECFLIHFLTIQVQENSRNNWYWRLDQFKSSQLWNINQEWIHRGCRQLQSSSSQRREKGKDIRGLIMICIIITLFLFVARFFFFLKFSFLKAIRILNIDLKKPFFVCPGWSRWHGAIYSFLFRVKSIYPRFIYTAHIFFFVKLLEWKV